MNDIRIYTSTYCGYCVAAKRLLKRKGLAFEEIDANSSPELRDWLVTTTGSFTVPQIFLYDEPIGGYDELAMLERSGQLDKRVAEGRRAAHSV